MDKKLATLIVVFVALVKCHGLACVSDTDCKVTFWNSDRYCCSDGDCCDYDEYNSISNSIGSLLDCTSNRECSLVSFLSDDDYCCSNGNCCDYDEYNSLSNTAGELLGLGVGAIVGIGIGGVVFLIIICVLIGLCCSKMNGSSSAGRVTTTTMAPMTISTGTNQAMVHTYQNPAPYQPYVQAPLNNPAYPPGQSNYPMTQQGAYVNNMSSYPPVQSPPMPQSAPYGAPPAY